MTHHTHDPAGRAAHIADAALKTEREKNDGVAEDEVWSETYLASLRELAYGSLPDASALHE